MGLDMYLMRYPKYKDYGVKDIEMVEEYLKYMADESVQKKYSLKEWCGVDENDLPRGEDMEFFKGCMKDKYYAWDERKRHSYKMIKDNVAYWRKANAIHRWFVDNVQDGMDDCGCYEVKKSDIEELRDICGQVLEGSVLVHGKVETGTRLVGNRWEKMYEDGMVVLNPDVCNELLPTTDGFFFGSKNYDNWYIDDVKYTYEVLGDVLDSTDFDNQVIFYESSW